MGLVTSVHGCPEISCPGGHSGPLPDRNTKADRNAVADRSGEASGRGGGPADEGGAQR